MARTKKETKDGLSEGEIPQLFVYEIGYHLLPSVDSSGRANFLQEIKEMILGFGGEIIAEEISEEVFSLAYKMERRVGNQLVKTKESYFGWLKFAVSAETAQKIKEHLEKDTRLVRFIFVKTVRQNTLYGRKLKEKDERSKRNDGEAENDLAALSLESALSAV